MSIRCNIRVHGTLPGEACCLSLQYSPGKPCNAKITLNFMALRHSGFALARDLFDRTALFTSIRYDIGGRRGPQYAHERNNAAAKESDKT